MIVSEVNYVVAEAARDLKTCLSYGFVNGTYFVFFTSFGADPADLGNHVPSISLGSEDMLAFWNPAMLARSIVNRHEALKRELRERIAMTCDNDHDVPMFLRDAAA